MIRKAVKVRLDKGADTSAYAVKLHDPGHYFVSNDLEGALQEVGEDIVNIKEEAAAVDEILNGEDGLTLDRYDDITFELTPTRINPVTSKPDFDYTNNGFLFPNNDPSEAVYFTVQMPHRYLEGGDIHPHVHIRQAADQQCVFKIDYMWYNIGDDIPAGTTTYVMDSYGITYVDGTISQVVKNDTPISGTGKKISSFLKIKLYRDDAVYTGDVFVDQFDIHIPVDALGSRQEYIK